jgi:hypothetical protein
MVMRAFFKGLHKRTLTCLNSSFGFAVFLTITACSCLITLQVVSNSFLLGNHVDGPRLTREQQRQQLHGNSRQRDTTISRESHYVHREFSDGGVNRTFWSEQDYGDNIGHVHLERYLAYGPIDVVYTWVNGSDPIWLKKKEVWYTMMNPPLPQLDIVNASLVEAGDGSNSTNSTANATVVPVDDTNASNRYRDSNELLYSLRSIQKNAPWVRKIFIVTDNQVPNWLNLENDRISIVTHEDIFVNKSHLPVFSSPAIESHLHRIPGLSKKFIYFNDDVFLGTRSSPEDFVSVTGVQKFYLSWDVPKCAIGCSDSWIGDGYCDAACNVSSCNFDFPDCVNGSNVGRGSGGSNAYKVNPQCVQGCPDNWLGDKVCDMRCKNVECGWDAGDCGIDKVVDAFPGMYLHPSVLKVVKQNTVLGNVTTINPAAGTSVSGESGQVSVTNETVGEPTIEDLMRDIPVAFEVEQGTNAVYLNTSLLKCQTITDGSYCDVETSVPGFQLTHAEFVEGSVVHVAVLLTKHQVLILVLFNGQENSPERPTKYPYDSLVTISGTNTITNISMNATFLLRTIDKVAPSKENMGYPSRTNAVHGHFGACISPNKNKLRTPLGSPYHLAVSNAALLPKAFEYEVSSQGYQQGIVVQADVGSPAVWPSALLELPLEQVKASVSISMINDTRAWNLTMPLTSLVGIADPQSLAIHRLLDAGISLRADATMRDLFSMLSSVKSHSALLEEINPKKSRSPHMLRSSIEANAQKEATPPNLELLLLLPVPLSWPEMVKRSWIHAKVVLFADTAETPLTQPDSLPASSLLPWKEVPQLSPAPAAVSVDQNSSHTVDSNETLPGDLDSSIAHHRYRNEPKEQRILCIVGSFKWGGGPTLEALSAEVALNSSIGVEDSMIATNSPEVVLPATVQEIIADVNSSLTTAENIGGESRRLLQSYGHNDVIIGARISLRDHIQNSIALTHRQRGRKDVVLESSRTVSGAWDRHDHSVVRPVPEQRNDEHVHPLLLSFLWTEFVIRPSGWIGTVASWVGSLEVFNSWLNQSQRHDRRRLEDTYAQSLIHVNRLYNKEFGTEAVSRKVPAHMPHMIDKDYVSEMQHKWAAEWDETSTHRFRSSKDMQYSFSYYYYVMNRNRAVNVAVDILPFVRDEIDSTGDGYVDENEFLSLLALTTMSKSSNADENNAIRECVEASMNAASASKQAEKYSTLTKMFTASYFDYPQNDTSASNHTEANATTVTPGAIHNSSQHSESVSILIPSGPVESVSVSFAVRRRPSVEEVANCSLVGTGLKTYFLDWTLYKPSHTIGLENNVAFEMIGDNLTVTLGQLNSVRARRSKFICINDNMANPSKELELVLQQFFESFFPIPSQFELPPDVRNPTVYYDEYLSMRRAGQIPHAKTVFYGANYRNAGGEEGHSLSVRERIGHGLTVFAQTLQQIRLKIMLHTANVLRGIAEFLQPSDTVEKSTAHREPFVDDDEEVLLRALRKDIAKPSKRLTANDRSKSSRRLLEALDGENGKSATDTVKSSAKKSWLNILTSVKVDLFVVICVISFIGVFLYARMLSADGKPRNLKMQALQNSKGKVPAQGGSPGDSGKSRFFDIDGGARARRSLTGGDVSPAGLTMMRDPNSSGKSWGWIRRSKEGAVEGAANNLSSR